jgi:hypothetical protein
MKGWKSKSVDWTTLHRKKEENPRGLNMKTHLWLTKHAPPAPKRQTEYKNPRMCHHFFYKHMTTFSINVKRSETSVKSYN